MPLHDQVIESAQTPGVTLPNENMQPGSAFDVWTVHGTALTSDDPAFQTATDEINALFPQRRIRNVLLISPPDTNATGFNFKVAHGGRYNNFPPYGLGLLVAQLRLIGIEANIINLQNALLRVARQSVDPAEFDFNHIVDTHINEAINRYQPDLIGITCMFSVTHDSAVDICQRLRARAPQIPVALGGVHITNGFNGVRTREALTRDFQQVDFLFMHEADVAFRDFISIVNQQEPITLLSQIVFNRLEPKLHFANRSRPSLETIDIIPAQDQFELSELALNGTIGAFQNHCEPGTLIASILFSRGCRAQCAFCSVRNFNGAGVRGRSVASVMEELRRLRDVYGVRHVMWLDDDFLYDPTKKMQLFQEMVRTNLGMTWDLSNGVIAAACTEELIAAAAAAGCVGLNIGMESGNEKILRMIKKPGTVANFRRAAEIFRRHETINARVNLIIGFPGETYRMILDTIQVASEMFLDWYNIHNLQVLPNTPINEMIEDERNRTDFKSISIISSSYNNQMKDVKDAGDILALDFSNVFDGVDLDSVPPPEVLPAIWAYMNFKLNYATTFLENRPLKLFQKLKRVDRMVKTVVPRSAIAWYFNGYLQHRVHGHIEPETLETLKQLLDASTVWRARFERLGLSIDTITVDRPDLAKVPSPIG